MGVWKNVVRWVAQSPARPFDDRRGLVSLPVPRARVVAAGGKARIQAAAEVEKLRISEEHKTARYRIAASGASPSPMAEVVHELESGRRQGAFSETDRSGAPTDFDG